MSDWGSNFGAGICGDAVIVSAQSEAGEQRIREYVQWQEKKEQEIEQMQGKLFDEN